MDTPILTSFSCGKNSKSVVYLSQDFSFKYKVSIRRKNSLHGFLTSCIQIQSLPYRWKSLQRLYESNSRFSIYGKDMKILKSRIFHLSIPKRGFSDFLGDFLSNRTPTKNSKKSIFYNNSSLRKFPKKEFWGPKNEPGN